MPSASCEGMSVTSSDTLLIARAYDVMAPILGYGDIPRWSVAWHGMFLPCIHADISGHYALVECVEGYRDSGAVANGESALALMGLIRHAKRFLSALIDA
jgi:hypothetical protein